MYVFFNKYLCTVHTYFNSRKKISECVQNIDCIFFYKTHVKKSISRIIHKGTRNHGREEKGKSTGPFAYKEPLQQHA